MIKKNNIVVVLSSFLGLTYSIVIASSFFTQLLTRGNSTICVFLEAMHILMVEMFLFFPALIGVFYFIKHDTKLFVKWIYVMYALLISSIFIFLFFGGGALGTGLYVIMIGLPISFLLSLSLMVYTLIYLSSLKTKIIFILFFTIATVVTAWWFISL